METKAICVTLPASTKWEEYEKELKAVEECHQVMNFKVPFFPKEMVSRCYIVHKGFIIGWMSVVGYAEEPFQCTTTGQKWTGKFIKRCGKFHYLQNQIPMKGFQGFKYLHVVDDGTQDGKISF